MILKFKMSKSLRISHSMWMNAEHTVKEIAKMRGMSIGAIQKHARILDQNFLIIRVNDRDFDSFINCPVYMGIEEGGFLNERD